MRTVKDIIDQHKVICWYPSAGADFRTLMFLSKQYCEKWNVPIPPNECPDLFIMTDCKPQYTAYTRDIIGTSEIEKLNGMYPSRLKNLFSSIDLRTKITVKKMEILERLNIPFDQSLYYFDRSNNYGSAYYMRVHVKSKQLGEWDTDVLYILNENTSFGFRYLLYNKISIDYIVCVRYGDCFGESSIFGVWLLKLIKYLHVKYYISRELCDKSFQYIPEKLGKEYADLKYIWENTDILPLNDIYYVHEYLWSNQGDIHWYKTEI